METLASCDIRLNRLSPEGVLTRLRAGRDWIASAEDSESLSSSLLAGERIFCRAVPDISQQFETQLGVSVGQPHTPLASQLRSCGSANQKIGVNEITLEMPMVPRTAVTLNARIWAIERSDMEG